MSSLAGRVEALLAPGGRLATRWPRYEERFAQRALAADVARTIEDGGILLAEAPTGVGKSLAYLLPALLAAMDGDRRVVVATCTKSLQDQLFERDLPALLEALEMTLPCARLKGKQNYLCSPALDSTEAGDETGSAELDRLRVWAADDPHGDLDLYAALDAEAWRRLRPRVAADPVSCSGLTCRRGRECFWVRARRQAAATRLLVVNHALLALSGEAEGLLPEFDVLVVDEAHRLEGVLLAQLERSVSRGRFEEALRVIGSGRRPRVAAPEGGRGGLAARLRGLMTPLLDARAAETFGESVERLVREAAATRPDVERFFDTIEPRGPRDGPYGLRQRYAGSAELLGNDLAPLETLHAHGETLARTLRSLAAATGAAGGRGEAATSIEALATDLEHAAAVWESLDHDLLALTEASARGWVHWRTASAHRGVELHGAPVEVGDHAHRLVLGRARSVVLTSATLSAGGDFRFMAQRLGLGESEGVPYHAVSYPSPFPLERQMRVFVHAGDGDEADTVARLVSALAAVGERNQLVLFTAHERLRRARERLLTWLPTGTTLLAQEWDGPAGLVSERFRAGRGTVLLGVQSLWEGVDFPGETLEILIVTRLPFAVPDDPLVEARGERLAERGLDPFRHDAVPEAVLRFRQGAGRLIRRADDRGVFVVCDPRLTTASYRRPFLAALPVAPERLDDPEQLAAEAARFLAGGPAATAASISAKEDP
ncbi:MAG: ATP-dependent DNA helicase [Candidatus Eisenbacteria bacterium]